MNIKNDHFDISGLKGIEFYNFLIELYNDTKNKELFMEKYTRKNCHKILQRLHEVEIKQKPEYAQPYAFNAMTKERAYKHIKFYLELHNYDKRRTIKSRKNFV